MTDYSARQKVFQGTPAARLGNKLPGSRNTLFDGKNKPPIPRSCCLTLWLEAVLLHDEVTYFGSTCESNLSSPYHCKLFRRFRLGTDKDDSFLKYPESKRQANSTCPPTVFQFSLLTIVRQQSFRWFATDGTWLALFFINIHLSSNWQKHSRICCGLCGTACVTITLYCQLSSIR